MHNEYHVWFGIHDFECSPDELTKQLGIKPTRTKIKGEYRTVGKKKPRKMLNKENQWFLDSVLPRDVTIEEQLKHLVGKIKPHKQKLIEITKKYYTEFGCAIYHYEVNPGIHLDNNLLKEIAELNARIDLDIYCLTEGA